MIKKIATIYGHENVKYLSKKSEKVVNVVSKSDSVYPEVGCYFETHVLVQWGNDFWPVHFLRCFEDEKWCQLNHFFRVQTIRKYLICNAEFASRIPNDPIWMRKKYRKSYFYQLYVKFRKSKNCR